MRENTIDLILKATTFMVALISCFNAISLYANPILDVNGNPEEPYLLFTTNSGEDSTTLNLINEIKQGDLKLFDHHPSLIVNSVIRGPYLQSGTPTSTIIRWRTDNATDSKVWYGDSPNTLNQTISINGNREDHEINVTGLTANTVYYYAVGDSNGQLVGADSSHYFKTSMPAGTTGPIRAWVFGDCGTATNEQEDARDAYYNFIGNNQTDMILLLGDNAYSDGLDFEYQNAFFDVYTDILKHAVAWSAPGNHEYGEESGFDADYYEIFTFPENGEAGGLASNTEKYYSFDYGNIHIISLDSHDEDRSLGSPMLTWLENDLGATTQEWIIVIFHHAPYSKGSRDSDNNDEMIEMRENVLPICDNYGVDLILSGHSHSYERSKLIHGHYGYSPTYDPALHDIDGGDGRLDGDGFYQKNAAEEGIVYIVSGSAGQAKHVGDHPVMYYAKKKMGTSILEVDGSQMGIKFLNIDGEIEDYLTLVKLGPPRITWTSPDNEDNFYDLNPIALEVDATDNNGTINQVEFFVNGVSIGTDTTEPYSLNWAPPYYSDFDIEAIATDNDGETSSSEISISVQYVPNSDIEVQINDDDDDVEERNNNGAIILASSDLELVQDGSSNQTVGLRFNDINIPPGVTITNAYIQFTAEETHSQSTDMTVYGEDHDNAPPFTNSVHNASSRTTTDASINWTPVAWSNAGEAGPDQQTPDLSTVVQEIIDRPGWTENNSMVFLLTGTGTRTAYSHDGNPSNAPTLHVAFSQNSCIPFVDADGDGYCSAVDCDDADASAYPEATEVCDGADNDCNGLVDEGVTTTYFADVDNDGFGDPTDSLAACSAPSGYVTDNTDCDDTNAATFPGATEICDGKDNDCNGVFDDGWSDIFYADTDSDGFGNPNSSTTACIAPTGYVTDNTDCDDAHATAFPGGTEVCDEVDNDCDGQVDEGLTTTYFADNDSDGYGDPNNSIAACSIPSGYVTDNTDCDDAHATAFPGGTEVCDGVDNNCDGQVDEGVTSTFYADTDGDGFGDPNNIIAACGESSGVVLDNTDCDDTDASIYIGGTCDDGDPNTINDIYDNNCICIGVPVVHLVSQIDDGDDDVEERNSNGALIMGSSDIELIEDGSSDQTVGLRFNNIDLPSTVVVVNAYIQFTVDETDTKSTDLIISGEDHDNAPPFVNSNQNVSSRATTAVSVDWDVENWTTVGEAGSDQRTPNLAPILQEIISRPGWSPNNSMAFIFTGAGERTAESYDGNPASAATLYITYSTNLCYPYVDEDGDGFCSDVDCDDDDVNIHPSVSEVCDGIDNNCDGQVDEGVANNYYADTDSDGFGDPNNSTSACSLPSGYVTDNTDCDDTDAATHPGATEVCDGKDNNCDGQVDEGLASTYYADTDSDGFGDPNNSTSACSLPTGYVSDNTDCDDTDAAIHPGATEVCDGKDNNCDGQVDEGGATTYYADSDGDNFGDPNNSMSACSPPSGYVLDNTDCDDTDAAIHPGATEVCDDTDNNCDGQVDEGLTSTYYADTDSDGFGDPNNSIAACSLPTGYVSDNTDCDDTDASIYIGADCDDGDPNTVGDIYNGSCICVGVPVINFSIQIENDNDDAEERNSDGSISLSSSDLEIGEDGTTPQTVGMRFNDVNIPSSAVIISAYIQFTVDEADSGSMNLMIKGEDHDDPPAFISNSHNISNRTTTTASVNWSPSPWVNIGEAGSDQQTSNLASIVQEIIDRPGWSPNNAMVFIITGSGERTADSHDGNPGGAPVLFIAYSTNSCYPHVDSDSDGSCSDVDCDDNDPAIHPGATEVCDGIDNDCDGQVDEGVGNTYFADTDGDGFGDPNNSITDCSAPNGYITDSSDCNDADAAINPNATEACDGIDNDCDGQVDEGVTNTYYADTDSDGFGDPNNSMTACSAPSGFIADNTDCDDTDAAVNPNAAEACDGIDNDCDGQVDEGLASTFYADTDGDGFGDPNNSTNACSAPNGYVTDDTDCDDTDASVYVGASCDDGDPNTSNDTYGSDCICAGISPTTISVQVNSDDDDAEEEDGNGFVDLSSSDLELGEDASIAQTVGIRFNGVNIPPSATITNAYIQFTVDESDSGTTSLTIKGEDHDDPPAFDNNDHDITDRTTTTASVSWDPAPWTGGGLAGPDQRTADLSAIVQEIIDRPGWSANNSMVFIITGSGERTSESHNGSSSQAPVLNISYSTQPLCAPYVDADSDGHCSDVDCNDNDAAIHPGASEVCDGIDNDCDGQVDEGVTNTYYADTDGDGFGDSNNTTIACSTPSGYVSDNTDCDDSDPAIYIGAPCDDGDPNTNNDVYNSSCICIGSTATSISIQVNDNDDDAEERTSNGSITLTSSDLELVKDGSSNQAVGIRFRDIDIPPSSVVINAYIQFTVDEEDSGTANITIQGQDHDDASAFGSSTNNITSRSTTSASVAWNPVPWTTVGEAGIDQQTPDLSTIVQEVIDRPGWSANNSMVFIFTGTGERTAESYNGNPTAAPVLHVTYEESPSGLRSPHIDPKVLPSVPLFTDFDSPDLGENSSDFDNTGIGLEIATVRTGKNLHLYPNPVSGLLNIRYQSIEGKTAFAELLDPTGKRVQLKILQTKKGNNEFQMDLSRIPAGLYLFKIMEAGEQLTEKVLILN